MMTTELVAERTRLAEAIGAAHIATPVTSWRASGLSESRLNEQQRKRAGVFSSFQVKVRVVLRGFIYRNQRVTRIIRLGGGNITILGKATRTAKLKVSNANRKLVKLLGNLYSRLSFSVVNDAGDHRNSTATFELQP
jgi:hypothetical protein